MIKSKTLSTLCGQNVHIMHARDGTPLRDVLLENREIEDETFFAPDISQLHDPFLMPDMEKAVARILEARAKNERIVIFGDYDVDGVSSTALLYSFLTEIGCTVSYRLPHRVHDGYGIKSYHFDELATKSVKLVITVDCGTRDIGPIAHAKSLGIDVIVTDHHAVPDIIPEDLIALINPKRKDSVYPFSGLAGAGVAFALVRGIIKVMSNIGLRHREGSKSEGGDGETWIASCLAMTEQRIQDETITSLIDIASLGTVADCMPLIGENRVITALGLRQMKQSRSSALRKFIESLDRDVSGDADVIGFQIGPRINAAGRMDSPLKALHWLLARESRVDGWLEEVESLNTLRQESVKKYAEDALSSVDSTAPILFYMHDDLEHGLIGLVAGRLTETYHRPAIVLCRQHHESGIVNRESEVQKREYETLQSTNLQTHETSNHLVASCRSPSWCNLVELLDHCREYFVRYGGHRQAAGFTIEASRLADFQAAITALFIEKYASVDSLPKKSLSVECELTPDDISLSTLDMIDTFRPFGIGNPKPMFLIENLTIREIRTIGKETNHLSLTFHEIPDVKCLLWNYAQIFDHTQTNSVSNQRAHQHTSTPAFLPASGDILSPIFSLSRNVWNGRESLQLMIESFLDTGG